MPRYGILRPGVFAVWLGYGGGLVAPPVGFGVRKGYKGWLGFFFGGVTVTASNGVQWGWSPRKGHGAPGVIQHREGERKPSALGGGGRKDGDPPLGSGTTPMSRGQAPAGLVLGTGVRGGEML